MAATDASPIPVKNQAYRVTFPILDADGDLVTGATGLDSEVSKDGGTFGDCTNEATEIATASGMYFLDLTATEMNADTVAIVVKTTSSGAKSTPMILYPNKSGGLAVNVTAWAGSATATTNIALKNTLAKTTDVTGFNDLSTAQVNTECDTALSDIQLDHLIQVADPGGVVANNSFLAKLTSKSATAAFTSYDNTTDSHEALRDNTGTAGAGLTSSPDSAGTTTLLTRVPSALTITGGAVNVNDKTGFSLSTAGIDAIWAKTMTELSAVPGVTASTLDALRWLFILARNKITQTSTSQIVRNDADSATIGTATVGDDGTTFTRGEFA
jgi:hypothetical protein